MAHMEIEGDDKADGLAKEATELEPTGESPPAGWTDL